ncbi:RPS6 [Symbiodinium natans]|uniref:RPS6 protein n=1 Tax=Symbiodinium natans TaxID=878477 RepID=A0A812IYV3_9DINO|nr:RPS6 [Symbiodinium natans]
MSAIGAAATLMPISFLANRPRIPGSLFVRVADASYIRACSFLWQRFRPGAELFAIFILGRNALTVLCPLIPATSVKLVTMNILLYTSLVLVALGKPWRVPASNVLDIILHIGLLVVLDVASMFESPNKDTLTATIICLVFLLIMLFAIGAAMIFGLILHIARLRRKPWKFFLSHHKRAAGGIARLLKIQLQKRGSGYTTFLDTDNLSVLTELFSCVRDTETLVVLATPGILARKWCIGEIVTARLHSIRTVVLRWPQYTDPNEAFQQNLTFAIPGVEALTAYSISLDDVAETLRWFQTVDSIAVPGSWSLEVVGHLCDTLTGRPGPPAEEARTPDVIILADPGNQEAVATAYVIVELLLSSTAARYNAPLVLKKGDGIPENFQPMRGP